MSNPTDLAFFKFTAWTATLLAEPDHIPFEPTCRLKPDPTGYCPTQDQLFRQALKNKDAIPHAIGFYNSFTRPTEEQTRIQDRHQAINPPAKKLLISSSTLLFDLQPGINGYNGTAHGGLIGALIDESMGSFIFVNDVVYRSLASNNVPDDVLDMRGLRMFTAEMNVKFKIPLPTPGIVAVETKLRNIDGRKVYLVVTVKGEQGQEYATCDGLWISVPVGSGKMVSSSIGTSDKAVMQGGGSRL